ncbi:TfuA-like protein [Alkalilimnicola sp. S0819]|uniref:TfuA-like protein n=1 Tax=Alkalilimnicola sp. S0819 TaxID=2613922 RepID=UPI001869958A|nr:TfuA-like protein [Alkalilimnicola sp. S0819]
MHYDPARPRAVFLGPSLPLSEAKALLPGANYYPPVRLGDVYRLMGSGVHTLVLIDGLFDAVTPVWQRELLEALERGIRVIGAASMGALRAAELHPYGMEGVGQVFQWYRDGHIEGDDEVALMHAAEPPWRALSLPLVNIRHALAGAQAEGLLTPAQTESLLTLARNTFYGYRSTARLLRHARAQAWPRVDALAEYLRERAPDLKAEDARRALKRAGEPARPPVRWAVPARCAASAEQFRAAAHLRRGLWRADGHLYPGTVALKLLAAEPARLADLVSAVSKAFLLERALEARGVVCPAGFAEDYRRAWEARFVSGERADWLRANGLTEAEFHDGVGAYARLEWALADPARAGLVPRDDYPLLRGLLAEAGDFALSPSASVPGIVLAQAADPGLRLRLAEYRLLADWAQGEGIACPDAVLAEAWEALGLRPDQAAAAAGRGGQQLRRLVAERALADWLVAQGPVWLGWASWSADSALLARMQLSGEAGRRLPAHAELSP